MTRRAPGAAHSDTVDAPHYDGPRHTSTGERRRYRALGVALVSVLTFVAAAAGSAYQDLNSNVAALGDLDNLVVRPSASAGTEARPPSDPSAGTALNYLLLGSDDRSGENAVIGGQEEGMRADTTMVVHISEDRSRVDVVSIPRDSMVSIPSCTMTDGTTTAAQFGMFNSAFALGATYGKDLVSAVACTMSTVQSLTGLTIDGAIVVDFVGFEQMVNAIGGVPMCIPEKTEAPEANLYLEAGWQTLDGSQALGYARARKGVGQNFDGSDLTRTGRQQQLLAAVVNQLLSKNVLTDLPALYKFADAATSSLSVTSELKNPATLVGLAYSLRSIRPASVTFMTLPVEAYPADTNRVQWSAEADSVWTNLISDQPMVPAPEPSPDPTPATPSGEPTASASPSDSAPEPSASPTIKVPAAEPFTAADTTAVCG